LDNFQLEGLHVDAEGPVSTSNIPPWRKFKSVIKSLNKNAPKNTQYKVFFIARHGQGFHVRDRIPCLIFAIDGLPLNGDRMLLVRLG